jgi:hypothetical protein
MESVQPADIATGDTILFLNPEKFDNRLLGPTIFPNEPFVDCVEGLPVRFVRRYSLT